MLSHAYPGLENLEVCRSISFREATEAAAELASLTRLSVQPWDAGSSLVRTPRPGSAPLALLPAPQETLNRGKRPCTMSTA